MAESFANNKNRTGEIMKIQWYPGHMTKAKRAMAEDVKIVDLIVEMVDARAPLATRNPEIDQLGVNKARVIVLNKADMANERANSLWKEYFENLGYECLFMDSREKTNVKKLIQLIDKACEKKRERDRKRGILNRPIRAMVTGIPNVGKSTLINSISGRASAKTGNKPGVTKGNQWIKLNKSVELLDTPGILWPKFEDERIGEIIAFIGSINDMILDQTELAMEIIRWFFANEPNMFEEIFGFVYQAGMKPEEALVEIARVRNMVKKGGEFDLDKAAMAYVNDFRAAKLGRVTLELPPKETSV